MSDDPIIIIGTLFTFMSAGGGGSGSGSGEDSGLEPHPTLQPDEEGGSVSVNCDNVQQAVNHDEPDGATYYLPKAVTGEYLQNALKHISDFRRAQSGPDAFWAVRDEIVRMYTDRHHSHFVDFKRWGTSSGPPDTLSGGSYQYFQRRSGTNDHFDCV